MTEVNIIFDNILEDVDIIAVPDEIASKIEAICQEFLDWIPTANDNDYCRIIGGKKYLIAETDGFIKWLNSRYCSERAAYIVARNTNYFPLYKTIFF